MTSSFLLQFRVPESHTKEDRKNREELFPYMTELRFDGRPARRANITSVGLNVMSAIHGVPQAGKYIHAYHDVHLEIAPEGIDT